MISVRAATPADLSTIVRFIRALAEYERMLDEVRASESDIAAALFSPHPRAFCEIADQDGAAIGFALWFYNFSTFEGRFGIYLEDLFVTPEARGSGAGLALMRCLGQRCRDEDLRRLEWQVLDWNEPAIAFYDRLGAAAKGEWITRSLSGDALAALAAT